MHFNTFLAMIFGDCVTCGNNFKYFRNKYSNVGIHFRENKQCLSVLYSSSEQLNFYVFAGLLS